MRELSLLSLLEIVYEPYNPLVQRIVGGLPEGHRHRVVLLYQRRYPLDALPIQAPFDFRDQGAGQAMAAMRRMNNQPVHVAAPPIKTTDHGAHELSLEFRHQNDRGALRESPAKVGGRVCQANSRFRLPPQRQDRLDVIGPA